MSGFQPYEFRDQLSIDTPEQVDLRFSVAGIGSRFVAHLLDTLLLMAFFFVEGLVLWAASVSALIRGRDISDRMTAWAMALLVLVNFVAIWGSFSLFEAYWHGQTPGKRVMKLRVIKDSGRQITLFEALARNLMRFVDYLPGLYLTGVITMLCNRRNKRLGDFVAGTFVVHEQPGEQPLLMQTASALSLRPAATWQQEAPSPAIPALFPADAVARLNAQDLGVIEAFFSRALDLPLETRARMAERVAQQMAAKMNVPLPGGNQERALESIVILMRGGAA